MASASATMLMVALFSETVCVALGLCISESVTCFCSKNHWLNQLFLFFSKPETEFGPATLIQEKENGTYSAIQQAKPVSRV